MKRGGGGVASYRSSSSSAELKLLRRLPSLEPSWAWPSWGAWPAAGEREDSRGSAPNGDSASSIRIWSSRWCSSSFRVAPKKSVKCDSGSEKEVTGPSPLTTAEEVEEVEEEEEEEERGMAPRLARPWWR